jgi:multidrug efflux system membrane fusion protein
MNTATLTWQGFALGISALSLGMLTACNRSPATIAPKPTPVQVATVTQGPAQPPIDITGIVVARDELRLSFKVGGLVQRIAVREGDQVRKGQRLAELDPTEIAAQVEQARQWAEKATRDLTRGEALHADQVIPLEQLQNLRTQSDVARSQLRAARFNQQYAAIVAPADGVVLRRLVEERELVAPGQVILALGREDSGFIVRFAVSDRGVVLLRRGDAVDVTLDAWPGETFKAEVTQIASGAETSSGLFAIEARLASTPRQLVSGMVAHARLWPQSDAAQLPYLPLSSILEGDGQHAQVFVVDGTAARRRAIEIAFITADSVAVRRGIASGETVVTLGAPYLNDGGQIAIAP